MEGLIARCSTLRQQVEQQGSSIERVSLGLNELALSSNRTWEQQLQERSDLPFDPQRVRLPDAARDALAYHGPAVLHEISRSSWGSHDGAFVERMLLTRALERAGARLSRRDLRAVHVATAAGQPGRVNVDHLALLVATCRGTPNDGRHVGSHVPFSLPHGHGLMRRPSLVNGPIVYAQSEGRGMGAQRTADAVEEMVARLRQQEARLRSGDQRHLDSVRMSPISADSWREIALETEVEASALRSCLADADATIQSLLARLDQMERSAIAQCDRSLLPVPREEWGEATISSGGNGSGPHYVCTPNELVATGGTGIAAGTERNSCVNSRTGEAQAYELDKMAAVLAARGQRASFEAYAASYRQGPPDAMPHHRNPGYYEANLSLSTESSRFHC